MNNIKRNKRKIYLCKRYTDEETNVTKFEKPIQLNLNWQEIDSNEQILQLGFEYNKYIRIKCTKKEAEQFKNRDRCYIYVEPKKGLNFDVMCYDADYEVKGNPVITLNDAEIMLKKLSGADDE